MEYAPPPDSPTSVPALLSPLPPPVLGVMRERNTVLRSFRRLLALAVFQSKRPEGIAFGMGIHGVGEGDDEREDAREGDGEDVETHCLGGGWLW